MSRQAFQGRENAGKKEGRIRGVASQTWGGIGGTR